MSAHAVQMPSLAGLRLSAATGAPGDPSSDSGRSTPPPAVLQMYGNLQSAAALAEQAKLVLAQAREAAADERKAAAAAAKASAAASRAAERAAEREVQDNEQAAKNEILWKAHKLKQQAAREDALERVKVVMQKLEWPKNQGRELPKRDRERLLRELFEAQKTIDRTAQTWAQLSKNRRKYKEQLALIEEAREWRESARPAARKMGNILKQRKVDKSKFERDMAKHAKRRKEAKVQQQRTDREKRVAAARAAADAAAHERIAQMAAQAAQAGVQGAEEVLEAKCEDALGQLHEMRAELKAMAQKFGQAMIDVEDNCAAIDPSKGKHDQWMYDIMRELAKLQAWIEQKEFQDPGEDGWDVAGHLAQGGESLADSDSDSDSDEEDVANNPFWQAKGATEGKGNLFDDIDEAFGKDDEIEAEEDDSDEFQMNLVLTTEVAIANNDSPEARERAEKFLAAFLAMLKAHEDTKNMTQWTPANLAAYQLGPRTVLLSLMLTYDLVEKGRNVEEGTPTPYDIIQGHLDGVTLEQWYNATEIVVTNVEGTGIPSVNDEEAEWLDEHASGWEDVNDKGRLLNLIMQAQSALQLGADHSDPKKEIQRFDATDKEKRYVYEAYKDQLGIPPNWLDDPATAEQLDDEMKLAMLRIAREAFGDLTNEEEGDDVDDDVDEDLGVMN